jgi:Restriction endonuclease
MSEYKELEKLVARIQQQLAPRSQVIHNTKMKGRRTQRMRQIDVLVKDKIAQFDINIIIDCKDYKHAVDVKGVEEFYGLLDDVGAQKGVLVCPKGFTETAKIRAEGLQIDLYSPVDTDPHKWQAKVTMPALCDFRSAAISFGVRFSAPLPMRILPGFFNNPVFSKRSGEKLGTIAGCGVDRWNNGGFPTDVGEHENLSIFDEEVTSDNGYGMQAPMHLYVGLRVTRQLYFGQLPITKISGFKDEIKGGVIANAFQVGMLHPDEVEKSWQRIENESDAPIHPVILMTGLVGWVEPESEPITQGLW